MVSTYSSSCPDFSGIVSFNFTVSDSTANGGLDQTYSINVAEINDAPTINLPNSRTDLSIVGGTQQFVSFNDFGYQDIEGDLLEKVEIMAPSSEIATIYRSNVAFSTEGKTALDVSDDGKVILDLLAAIDLDVYIHWKIEYSLRQHLRPLAAHYHVVDRILQEFERTSPIRWRECGFQCQFVNVGDDNKGTLSIEVAGAPQSADDAFREAAFKLNFEEIVGEGRYWAVKETLRDASLTPDEGLEVLKDEIEDDQDFYAFEDASGNIQPPTDAQFYWDINWFGDSDFSDVLSEISALNLADADINSQLAGKVIDELASNPEYQAIDLSLLESKIASTLSEQEDLETLFGDLRSLTKDDLNDQTDLLDIKQSLLDGDEGKASTWLRVALFASASDFDVSELDTASDGGDADQLIYDLYADLQTSKLSEISDAVGELPEGIEYSPEQLARIQEVGQKVAANPGAVDDLKQATQVLSTKQLISTVIDELITEYMAGDEDSDPPVPAYTKLESIDLAFDKYIADNFGDPEFDLESVENYKDYLISQEKVNAAKEQNDGVVDLQSLQELGDDAAKALVIAELQAQLLL